MAQKPELNHRLLHEQVNLLYEQSYIASAGAVIAALSVGLVLWPHVSQGLMIAWMAAAITVTLARFGFTRRYRRLSITHPDAVYWKQLFIRLIFLSGLIWGSSAFLVSSGTPLPYQIFLSFILVSMVSGGIVTFSAVLPAFLAYAVPALLPLSTVFFINGEVMQLAMGGIILIYLALASVSALHLYKKTRTTLLVQFENIDLIRHLEQEKQRADAINKNLKYEVAERKQIEETLKKHQENLEAEVGERTEALRQSNMDLKMEIAERKKTETALKESEEKYRLVVENANDAIVIFRDDRVWFQNKRASELLGYPPSELSATPLIDRCHANDRRYFTDLLQDGCGYGDTRSGRASKDLRMTHQAGYLLWVRISVTAVTWENAPALLLFIRDVSRQKRLEQQLFQAQRMEAIGAMAAGIAHDFNNILSGIQGTTSLALMKMEPSHEHFNAFTDIESFVASGTDLTRQLLDFASSKQADRQPTDINQLLNDTATLFCRTRKELRLHASYFNGVAAVETDGGQIRQAVINLLVNAWQAMPEGGDIYLKTENVRLSDADTAPLKIPSGWYVLITITDTGPGMDPSVVSRIFDPFFTTKKRGQGTGLGLSSVYGIIQRHGGHITVDSQPGIGSVFSIYLPASQKQAVVQQPAKDIIVSGTETILIVDDEPDILEIGKEMLEALGYKVYAARNGDEAITLFSTLTGRIHMVILDMVMPGKSGGEVYDRLQEVNPDVRVLISSGYSQNSRVEALLKKGCSGFIQKPFSIQLLSRKVRNVLDAGEREGQVG
ncbi:MAG: response regulator [Desulfosalsimonadaceae bacterium]|nr:response regulator [Desulfosalsimonadaceae bacterium]